MPSADSLVREVEAVELDLDFVADDEEKQKLEEAKATKTWRLLRIAAKDRLGRFDKVEDGKNVSSLIQSDAREDGIDEGVPNASEDQGNTASGENARQDEATVDESTHPAADPMVPTADSVVPTPGSAVK